MPYRIIAAVDQLQSLKFMRLKRCAAFVAKNQPIQSNVSVLPRLLLIAE